MQHQQQHPQRTWHKSLTLARTALHTKVCSVDIGKEEEVKIVTNAGNVAEGSRVVVACVGAIVQGEALKKKAVGGGAARLNALPWPLPELGGC